MVKYKLSPMVSETFIISRMNIVGQCMFRHRFFGRFRRSDSSLTGVRLFALFVFYFRLSESTRLYSSFEWSLNYSVSPVRNSPYGSVSCTPIAKSVLPILFRIPDGNIYSLS